MRYKFCIFSLIFIISCFIKPYGVYGGSAAGDGYIERVNIVTADTMPLYIDKLLYAAFDDIGFEASFSCHSLQSGYEMANSGERCGIVTASPDMDKVYPNLIKVPTPLEDTYVLAFVRSGSYLRINNWNNLSGLTVGILNQSNFSTENIPQNATVVTEETNKVVLQKLIDGDFDVALLAQRAHEELSIPDGVERAAQLDTLTEYLYLNNVHERFVPDITKSLEAIFSDGRGEKILNDITLPNPNRKKTILYIISSSTEMEREAMFSSTLRENFEGFSDVEWYSVSLYSRRHSIDPNRQAFIAQLLRSDFVSKDVAAIMVSGKSALEFISEYYLRFFRNTPVIFYGMDNNYEVDIRDFEHNFTGILETTSAYDTMSFALDIFPDTKSVFIINDFSPEGLNYRHSIAVELEPFERELNINYNRDVSHEELLRQIKDLPDDSLVFVGSYFRDSKQYYTVNDFTGDLQANCNVPVFSLYTPIAAYTAIGGKAPDYSLYSATISEMLKLTLNGSDISKIPLIRDSSHFNVWFFDKNMLNRWGISERLLPKGSLILNKLPPIWESDPRFAIALMLLFIFGIISTTLITLSVNRFRRQKAFIDKDAKIKEVTEQLGRIINTAPILFSITVDNTIVEINDAFKKFTGLDKGSYAGKIFENEDEYDTFLQLVTRDDFIKSEIIEFHFMDGTPHRCLVNVASAEYDQQYALVIWAIDIEEYELNKDQLVTARYSLQAILDAMPIPVGIVERETLFTLYANDASLSLFKFDSLNEAFGKPLQMLIEPAQGTGISAMELCDNIVNLHRHFSTEAQIRDKTGKLVDVRILSRQIDYNSKHSSIVILTDLTQEKEYQQMHQSLQTVLDLLPMPIGILNITSFELIYINNATAGLFKLNSPDEAYHSRISSFFAFDEFNSSASIGKLENLELHTPTSIELVCCDINGQHFDCLITYCLIEYKGEKSLLALMKDLTAEKEYEKMLRNTAEREKEANQLKSRFLVNMSHEIRTPMNIIIGLTEIELRKNLQKDVMEIYKKINVSAKNLLQIINDILDLSKIEADKIELFDESFELEEVVNSALLVAAPRLDGKNVEFLLSISLDLPRYIIGDRTRLWQILKNFLDNSAKYTEKGKIVLSVFLNAARSDSETVYIAFIIEDTGIGISDEQMKKLFMPYEQIYNEAQKRYTGTGLGMVISKQLCELMGGEMMVKSAVGEGTSIFMGIPFKRSDNPETSLNIVKTLSLSGLNILIVDDDQVSLGIMQTLLEVSEATCTLARNGQEALDIIFKCRKNGEMFDLILLDYMMDGLDGIETARQIQAGLSKAPKLLMVTAYQRLLLKEELKANGIDDLIEKPFIPSQFINKLRTAIGYAEEAPEPIPTDTLIKFKDVHVLLCEDYHLNQEVANGMFEQFGVTSSIAENGAEAVKILESGEKFDLIFMDLQMPVMDGYEATGIIRANPEFDNIPIISLTADAMKHVVDKCQAMGMNDHLAKPLEFEHLNRVLAKWLPESKRVIEIEQPANPTAQAPIIPVPPKQMVTRHLPTQAKTMNKGLARFGGKTELYEKALREFARSMPEKWDSFEYAVSPGNLAETKRTVHKFKGAAGNLAEDEIYECAVQFESSVNNNSPDKSLYSQLIDSCARFKERVISQEKQTENNAPPEIGTPEQFSNFMEELRAALQNYDPKGSTNAIKALKNRVWDSSLIDAGTLEQLYTLTSSYEFDDALDMLDSMEMNE